MTNRSSVSMHDSLSREAGPRALYEMRDLPDDANTIEATQGHVVCVGRFRSFLVNRRGRSVGNKGHME